MDVRDIPDQRFALMGRFEHAAAEFFRKVFGKVTPGSAALQGVSVEEPSPQQEGPRERKSSPPKLKASRANGSKTPKDQADDIVEDTPVASSAEGCPASPVEDEERQVKKGFKADRE